jgi:hypothetical protein
MNIDKQKLLQWIERKLEIFAPSDSDSEKEALVFRGRTRMLHTLLRDIESGEFKQEEDEQNENETN